MKHLRDIILPIIAMTMFNSSCSSTKPYSETEVDPVQVLGVQKSQLKYFGNGYVTSTDIYLAIEAVASLKADPSKIKKTETGVEIECLQYENNSVEDLNWVAKNADKLGVSDKIISKEELGKLVKKIL